jgi:hypothetical protein
MSHAAKRVFLALHELDAALQAHIAEEAERHVPRDAAVDAALRTMRPGLVELLLEHMPTLAHPWRVVDMRDGEPTKLVRDGYRGTIATVRRVGQGKRGRPRWTAFVGNEIVSPPDVDENGDAMPIDWSTREEAQAACDANLRDSGVTIVDAPLARDWTEPGGGEA